MHPEVTAKAKLIAEICRRNHTRRLELFGSAATGRFKEESSDLDFLVEFEPLAPSDYANAWFGLREDLEALFGRHVDLVTIASLKNPYFAASVAATKQPVYAS